MANRLNRATSVVVALGALGALAVAPAGYAWAGYAWAGYAPAGYAPAGYALAPQKKSCADRKCDRWAIKTSTPGDKVKVEHVVSLPDFIAFTAPDHAAEAHAKSEYQDKRLPGNVGAKGEHEGSIVRVEGYLRVMQHDGDDGDYHLQVSPTWDSNADSTDVIVEVPDPAILPAGEVHDRAATMRAWLDKLADHGKVSGGTGNLLVGKTWVFVEGQLFFDHHHYPNCGERGKRGRHATTCWEIHPVTAIGFAPKSHEP